MEFKIKLVLINSLKGRLFFYLLLSFKEKLVQSEGLYKYFLILGILATKSIEQRGRTKTGTIQRKKVDQRTSITAAENHYFRLR